VPRLKARGWKFMSLWGNNAQIMNKLRTPSNVIYFVLFSFIAVLIGAIAFSFPESVHVVEAKASKCISESRSSYYRCEVKLPDFERPVVAMARHNYSGDIVMVRIARQPAINRTSYFIYGLAPVKNK
jgi:hypothetical protein